MHSNITTPGYSIAQQEMVWSKSGTVNHMKNVEMISWHNPKDGPTTPSNQNVQIVSKRTLKITSFWRILRAVNHDGCINFRRINEPQAQIIATSNESTNLKHRSSLRRTNWRIQKTESPRRQKNREAVSVRTIRLRHKSRILTHKPLKTQKIICTQNPRKAQKLYTYAQAA